jgi:hypothetical protein
MKSRREMMAELRAWIDAELDQPEPTGFTGGIAYLHTADGGRIAVELVGEKYAVLENARAHLAEIWTMIESRPLIELIKP